MDMDAARRRRLLLLVLGAALALIAGWAAFQLGTQGTAEAPEVPTGEVLVALQDIPARTEILGEEVAVREIPLDAILPQAYTTVEQATGQTTGVPIYAGQQITPNLFIGTSDDPLGIIPQDEEISETSPLWRAFSITVPRERAVGGLLQDGDRIDVVVSVALKLEDDSAAQDENDNLVPIGPPVALVTPDGPRMIRGGVTSKVTYTDLELLKADIDNNTYVVRVTLAQAEELTQYMRDTGDPDANPGGTDAFTLALRSKADTRDVDLTDFGQTLDRLWETYGYRLPFFLKLSEFLEFPVEFIELPILFPDLFEGEPPTEEPTPAPPQPEEPEEEP